MHFLSYKRSNNSACQIYHFFLTYAETSMDRADVVDDK